MSSSELTQWLETAEPLVRVESNRPFVLAGDRAWWVRRGRIDVFAVELAAGEQVGTRRHLFRVEAGGLLLGTGAAGSCRGADLLAVGGVGTDLVQLDRDRLDSLTLRPGFAASLSHLIEQWVDTVCDSMPRGNVPSECVLLAPGEEAAPRSSATARPAVRVGWVRHLQGQSLLLGRSELKVNGAGYTPLSERVWLEVGPGSRLHVASTATLMEDGSIWSGIDQLHALLLLCAAHDSQREARNDRARIRLKQRIAGATMTGAFAALGQLLHPRDGVALHTEGPLPNAHHTLDPLYAACRRVAQAMDIRIRPLPRSASATEVRDPLAALARANGFRTRQVVLRDGWWAEDCGPLLGSRADDRRPVALLPVSARRYRLFDPHDQTEEPITEELADSIAPIAHAFYRPLPDRPVSARELIRFGLSGCRRDLAIILGTGVAGGLLGLVVPVATGIIFNDIIPGAARSQLLQLTVILLAIALCSALFAITTSVALVRVESRAGSAVQAGLWDRLLGMPNAFFRPYTAGNLATRAMGLDTIRQIVSGATTTALLGGVFSLLHLPLLFYYSRPLALWALLLLAVALVVVFFTGRRQAHWEHRVAALQNQLAGFVLQFLSSVSKLRVAAAESHAFAIWAKLFGQQRELQFRARSVGNRLATFQAGFPLLSMIALYALALPRLTDPASGLRIGDFVAFMTSYGLLVTALMSASTALIGAVMVVPLYEQARPILQARPEVSTARTDPGILSGELEVQHLSFRYRADGPLVLRDLDLRIRAGEYVAFVGPSGSGKSTLLRLLLGFEVPGAGAIYYDGQELAGLDVQAVRRQIGVVLQNGRVMTGDIFINIAGSSNASLEEAWAAAAMAGFDEDIRKMPMGMHTGVSEGGGTLSGGQRQRLLIARAIVRRPRLLFFDEATSALDNRTQAIVSESLEQLQATRIVIAHRLSTIVNADRIYVVQAGQVVQSGTYGELVEQEGLFAELARRQLA